MTQEAIEAHIIVIDKLTLPERLVIYGTLRMKGMEFGNKGDSQIGNTYLEAARYFWDNFIIIMGGKVEEQQKI
ncbi:hypothetical protein HYX02_05540 [Candidatus Woesearchaeota archaeon]|nr:hypothetical protein [Candidatus Woesearchaeota archaeon]